MSSHCDTHWKYLSNDNDSNDNDSNDNDSNDNNDNNDNNTKILITTNKDDFNTVLIGFFLTWCIELIVIIMVIMTMMMFKVTSLSNGVNWRQGGHWLK